MRGSRGINWRVGSRGGGSGGREGKRMVKCGRDRRVDWRGVSRGNGGEKLC